MESDELNHLPLDELFVLLLHKKLMNKESGARRQAKKYYTDQYRRTGVIPKPLRLAGKGIMDGRKCSGRPRVIPLPVVKRFVEMVQASCDHDNDKFIFISKDGRTIKNFHAWLEEEFCRSFSLPALRRLVREHSLKRYLLKPDYDDAPDAAMYYFADVPVFKLVQVDGCRFRYFKIRRGGKWEKPQVIEFFDTGARYIFTLDACFSESNQDAVMVFSRFLLSTPFPPRTICLRPDNAKGFLNLKRAIHALNLMYSTPGGFFMRPDFTRFNAPKDKVHLESSHRSLHHFEMRIIKFFENRIVKTEPGYVFKKGRREKITVTLLDIDIEDLRNSGLIEDYRKEHNENKHSFSVNGEISHWVPAEKFKDGLSEGECFVIQPSDVEGFCKYGYPKVKATVSKKGTIRINNQIYYVAVGAESFSRHKSTPVYISVLPEKLYIFEQRDDGILVGEALPQKPYKKTVRREKELPDANEVERIGDFLESRKMMVDNVSLIKLHHMGLSLDLAKTIFAQNRERYTAYQKKLRQPESITRRALFKAFVLDCENHLPREGI